MPTTLLFTLACYHTVAQRSAQAVPTCSLDTVSHAFLYSARPFENILEKAINQEQGSINNQGDVSTGRLLALDLGLKRVGMAISDELQITIRTLPPLSRTNWKQLLRAVADTLVSFDACGLVLGLPLRLDGSEGEAAAEARRLARNFERSLRVPVYLQDERLTTQAAEEGLRAEGYDALRRFERLDSEAAAIILRDFMAGQDRTNPGTTNRMET